MFIKKLIFILFSSFLLINFFSVVSLNAADLHAILVGDSLNDSDRNGFEASIDLWHREVKRIAAYTGLQLQGVIFESFNCRLEDVLNYIQDLQIESDDVVILYFATHGSRPSSKETPWPHLHFSLDQKTIDFNYLNELIKDKEPRFFLSIADSCNEIDDHYGQPEKILVRKDELENDLLKIKNSQAFISRMIHHTSIDILNAYRHLFLNHHGTIIASGSIPGQPAIKHLITGGVYTVHFLESLKHYTSLSVDNQNWKDILERAAFETRHKLKQVFDPNLTFDSHYELNVF